MINQIAGLPPLYLSRDFFILISGSAVASSGMSVIVLSAFESFYYRLPCFPVIDSALTRVRMSLISSHGENSAPFDGFLRPSLLHGIQLPQVVTPIRSFDIEVRL